MSAAVFGDVTSANIVGYAGQDLLTEGDQKFVTAQFLNVGDPTSEIDLQTIRPTNDAQASGDGLWLAVLGGGGETVGYYQWRKFGDKYGWADRFNDNKYAEGVTFSAGTAFWVQNDSEDDLAMQTSGEVGRSGVTVELLTESDQCSLGNPFPVAVDLQNITPDDSATASSDGLWLAVLGGGGETVGYYQWRKFGDKYGWADRFNDNKYAEGVMINPGEGTWVQNDSEETLYLTVNPPASIAE